VRDTLLIVWLAVLGATRVDFLGGAGPLVLTPFLVLSPLVIAVAGWRVMDEGGEIRFPPRAAGFLMAVSALLALLLVSTFFAWDLPTSARRFSLLFVQVYLVFLVGIVLANRPDPAGILVRGAYAGVGLAILMNLGQMTVWFLGNPWAGSVGRFLDLEPWSYFEIVPRLAGAAHDPNLGGLLLIFYLALIVFLAPPSRVRSFALVVGVVAVLLTISRSAALAGLVLWGGILLQRLDIRVTPGRIGLAGGAVGLLTLLYLVAPGALDPLVRLAEVIGHRFTPEEGSASDHAILLARAWEVGTESLKHTLVGIGYGNAYVRVQDIFPGNEYGNFHSLLLTFFAEAGAGTALLTLGIFGYALVAGGVYRPLVAAMLMYNLFQQAHTDPVLWLVLMLAWVGIGTRSYTSDEPVGPLEPVEPRLEMTGATP